jgi:ATP-dependent DNA helicase DinG
MLNATPVDVAGAIREALLGTSGVEAAIFTSATLTTGGSFDYVRERLGLAAAAELRVDSPFDYREQALLYLPRDLPLPADATFVPRACERIEPLVAASGGRAFLLFTSHRHMLAAHALLAPRFAAMGLPVLLQGEQPKHLLLERFRARPTVLLATGSFWEGVDVVGEALQLVVIDKLPFAPPDDPLVAARARRVEEEGRSGFADYQVPQAALSLAQGFGRLIRHRRDRGVVAILDSRASTRGYGARVLSSLPADCPRTADLDEACRFLRALAAAHAAAPALDSPP